MKSLRPGAALATLLCIPIVIGACGDDAPAGPSASADATYTAEGSIERLPREGTDRREVSIAHEAIPSFRDREGQTVGMEAMSMQFEVAPGVALDGIETGDRVRFTFEVRWDTRPMLYVTELAEVQ